MVIEQSGGQFGLKSYALFQNRTSTQRSQVWFQTKIALHSVQITILLYTFWGKKGFIY